MFEPDPSLRQIAQKSLAEYKNMLAMLLDLNELLMHNHPSAIEGFNHEFGQIQSQTMRTDNELQTMLKTSLPCKETADLLQQKGHVQQNILDLVQRLTPQAMNMKSLLLNEMQTVRRGRNALHGYRPAHVNANSLISKRC